MKNSEFDKAIAFILEGDTELEFYLRFVAFLCEKHGYAIEHSADEYTYEPIDVIKKENGDKILVKYDVVGTISSMNKSAVWFKTQCRRNYQTNWCVCLCYDTDDYTEDVTRFHEGDWLQLRTKLKGANPIIDMVASADIEDIMLLDMEGICGYLEADIANVPDKLPGSKGKKKMKNLFRLFGYTYHEGCRAQSLIETLDMQLLIDKAPLPLQRLENWFIAG